MKKLLVLTLVLCLASVANATLQISVGGVKEPVDSEITIAVSDHLVLDIWTDADIPMFSGEVWMLVCDTTMGDITGGVSQHPWMVVEPGTTRDYPGVIPPPGEEGIWGNVFNLDATPIAAGTTLADLIDFHCLGEGDCIISLYQVVEGQPASVLFDQVVIHQIPEPASMLLLGLGGLLLRRRK
jgi:hypothetical protein